MLIKYYFILGLYQGVLMLQLILKQQSLFTWSKDGLINISFVLY